MQSSKPARKVVRRRKKQKQGSHVRHNAHGYLKPHEATGQKRLHLGRPISFPEHSPRTWGRRTRRTAAALAAGLAQHGDDALRAPTGHSSLTQAARFPADPDVLLIRGATQRSLLGALVRRQPLGPFAKRSSRCDLGDQRRPGPRRAR
ncbi:hypothetical protein SVAN01_01059 [Stagonosporopsis vannaccii]|nr:hypothetical protein SVAN01_01059 [Stagonosporopsis vannaccii]